MLDDNDYGVDTEVEIFDGEFATGITFKVQLKSTDEAIPHSVQVKRSTLSYWRELDVPVIILLYSSATQRFYFRWAHDRYGEGQKSVSIRFKSGHIVEDLGDIYPELILIRQIKRHQTTFPVSLTISPEGLQHLDPSAVAIRLSHLFYRTNGLVRYQRKEETKNLSEELRPHFSLAMSGGMIRTTLEPHLASLGVPAEESELTLDYLTDFVLIATANIFYSLGWMDVSRHLFGCVSMSYGAFRTPMIAAQVIDVSERANIYDLPLALAEVLSASDEEEIRYEAEPYVNAALRNSDGDSKFDRRIQACAKALIAAYANSDAPTLAAAPSFNLGNYAQRRGDYRNAIRWYKNAIALDPVYRTDERVNRDLAGMYYLIGEFALAANRYEALLSTSSATNDVARTVDSLLLAGEYEAARTICTSRPDALGDAYFFVVSECANVIHDVLANTRQRRKSIGSLKRTRRLQMGLVEILTTIDSLDASTWLEALHCDAIADPRGFVLAAHIENSATGWADCLVALDERDYANLKSIVLHAHGLMNGLLLEALAEREPSLGLTELLVDASEEAELPPVVHRALHWEASA